MVTCVNISRSLSSWDTAWIGLNDLEVEGVFRWHNHSLLTSNLWAPEEPKGGQNQNCVYLNASDSLLYTSDCTIQRPVFCDKLKSKYMFVIKCVLINYLFIYVYSV